MAKECINLLMEKNSQEISQMIKLMDKDSLLLLLIKLLMLFGKMINLFLINNDFIFINIKIIIIIIIINILLSFQYKYCYFSYRFYFNNKI